MEVTGAVKEQLGRALLDAFRKSQDLERMVMYKLDVPLLEVVGPGALRNMVFELIEWAESEGRLTDLVHGAHLQNPTNQQLRRFHDAFFSLVQPQALDPRLEKIVVDSNPFHDVVWWRAQQDAHELRVCRIEARNNQPMGTGFLVASNIVLTNHHVVRPVSEGLVQPDEVQLRFDFKRKEDGISVGPGRLYSLAKDWLLDSSPADPVDLEPEPKLRLPRPENLDHALLRVEGEPGKEVISGMPRGFIAIPHAPYAFTPRTTLVILQHAGRDPLQMAFDTEAILQVNSNSTRVTYRTNTLPGSSGSPCFNTQWELVALHHSGDPGKTRATYNEGIPISTLRAHLEKKGLMKLLGL
ncbi:effector-associated domain EAD1-containing protein [Corallococcus caeni]|uniref:Effector-associated domain-containing protein n=1 Tax=Corallococcus caeni TaxID=3082388 RepID=A0ABQ6QP02_9BACT|nr:hypothetical protein ASNO1_16840 [Corallococcus sp. NO1]